MAEAHDLVIERTLNAPRDAVWKALTTPDLIKQWFAPRPYQTVECALDLVAGGAFQTKMVGPDDFEMAGASCVLEVVEGEKLAWTTALLPGYRPQTEAGGGFPFTAVFTLADAGEGKTLYRATAMHGNAADRETHASMGFEQGWGTVAGQLEEVANANG